MREPISWATSAVVMAVSPALLVLAYWPFFGAGVAIVVLWGATLAGGCAMLCLRPTVTRSVGAGLVGACVALATLPILVEPVARIGGAIAGSAP